MRKIAVLLCCTVIAAVLGGCVSVGFAPGNLGSAFTGGTSSITGVGPMQEFTLSPGGFEGVDIGGRWELIYTNSPSHSVTAYIQENLFELFEFVVEQGVLVIRTHPGTSMGVLPGSPSPRLYIHAPALNSINISGSAYISPESDPITGDVLLLSTSGVVSGELELNLQSFNGRFSGASSLTLSGSAVVSDINVSGAGSIEAAGLETVTTIINVSGAGSAQVWANESLDARISGAGSVIYHGDPESVSQRVSGAGSITSAS